MTTAPRATVAHAAPRRFVVSGVIAVMGGRRVDESYSRTHATRGAAERDAASLDRQNDEAVAHLVEVRTARAAAAKAYIARRASRPAPAQMSLF